MVGDSWMRVGNWFLPSQEKERGGRVSNPPLHSVEDEKEAGYQKGLPYISLERSSPPRSLPVEVEGIRGEGRPAGRPYGV